MSFYIISRFLNFNRHNFHFKNLIIIDYYNLKNYPKWGDSDEYWVKNELKITKDINIKYWL